MVNNRSAPPGDVIPRIVYADADTAAAWLTRTFGFEERLRWGEGSSLTIQLAVGTASVLVIGPRTGHGTDEGLEFRPPRHGELNQNLHVRVVDVDAHHSRAWDAGASILLEPRTYPFGERQYSGKDLAGHLWTFTESLVDVDPASWGASRPGEVRSSTD